MAVTRSKKVEVRGSTLDVRTEMYNSAYEVAEDCKNRAVRHKIYDMSKVNVHKSWHGVGSYEEALDLMRNGYQPTVEELRGELNVAPKDGARISFKNSIEGFAPVVPLALKGVPNCMINMRMKPIKCKVLDVYYDMTANCDKEPEEFIKAGQALLGTVIELEKQGYRFNLYALQSYGTSWDKSYDLLCVKIKSSDKPLDLKRISFPLTHPSFFRVIGFDWQGKSPITRNIGSGRGRAMGYEYDSEDIRKIIRALYGDNACYISCSKFIGSGYDTKNLKEQFTNDKV